VPSDEVLIEGDGVLWVVEPSGRVTVVGQHDGAVPVELEPDEVRLLAPGYLRQQERRGLSFKVP
jgi:hypothetical protein